ncbi:hypothetical protein, partial [Sphingomonas sp. 66-10]|uniref:hypothetical protein n=1 Tax=Sphingomonas sp. 66-10 TaxID=1895848 RepID=UPI002580E545
NRENAIVPVTMLALPSIYTPTRLTKDMRLDNRPSRLVCHAVPNSRLWIIADLSQRLFKMSQVTAAGRSRVMSRGTGSRRGGSRRRCSSRRFRR